MFVSFLYPFRIRDIHAPFLWVFYKQLSSFKATDIIYIASEDYFLDPSIYHDRWEFAPGAQATLDYTVPTADELTKIHKYIISASLFDELSCLCTSNQAWVELITAPHEKLERELETILTTIAQTHELEAILTWCNCKSLTVVAERLGIKVIHNEQGPTRSPFYTQTAYFDFSGVNGNTEARARFLNFQTEMANTPVEILTKKELLYLITENAFVSSISCTAEPAFSLGLALQIEDDSNLLAYSNGYDNLELVKSASRLFGPKATLIRKHPRGHLEYPESLGVIDESRNSFEFFKKSGAVATINSSVGFEAVLHDKVTFILGDCPFSYLAHNTLDTNLISQKVDDELLGVNFSFFGYLIPYKLLFNGDYYRWRLRERSEIEIYHYHMDYYRRAKLIEAHLPETTRIDEIALLTTEKCIQSLTNQNKELKEHMADLRQNLEQSVQEKNTVTRQLADTNTKHENEISHKNSMIADLQEQITYINNLKDAEIKKLDQLLVERNIVIRNHEQKISALINSLSWRITAPLRFIFSKITERN